MRKAILFVLLGVLSVSSPGCIVVMGVDDLPEHRQIVEIDGELYVVNTHTHRVCKVDTEVEGESQTTTETQVETKGD